MDVAVDDPQPRLGGLFLIEHRAVDDITHAILLRLFLDHDLHRKTGSHFSGS
jgi:hypothetical protein